MQINPNDHLISANGIYYWEQPDESEAILVKSQEESKVLNTTGRIIWKLCDGKHSVDEILGIMVGQYAEVNQETLAKNLAVFLDELISDGYLIRA